ncbi:hypothetical protein V6N12_014444 [Hibiscus sabdariffa]|uniref:PSI subunit V n=1 Tax=Hibiscus sabdariffa TaxID=183260 RepID=A0ABR2DL33_9ROSI
MALTCAANRCRGRSSSWVSPGGTVPESRALEEHTGAGSLAAAGLVVILSICLTMYGTTSFKEGEPSTAPSLASTGAKEGAGSAANGRWMG